VRVPLLLAAAVALAVPATAATATPRLESPSLARIAAAPAFIADTTLAAPKAGRLLASEAYWGGKYTTPSGDVVTVYVSDSYSQDPAIAQRWANFLSGLVHGPELALVTAYLAPLDEVQTLCGPDALACYSPQQSLLVAPGDAPTSDISAEAVVTHEYGHHVAAHRSNPPWPAVDYGTKRWASSMQVCRRTRAGELHPGAESIPYYELNPGEAFAESYRVLNETAAGLPLMWPIVDPSFQPDAAALVALRQDVLDPWTAPTVSVRRVRFSKGVRKWTMQIATPLDGELHAQVQPGSDDVTVFAADGRTLLARGSWTASGAKALDYGICGQRTIVLRVTRDTPIRHLVLRLSVP
jgi:hypothetical protein